MVSKHSSLVLIAAVLLLVTPVLVSAQGFPGVRGAPMPPQPGMYPQPSAGAMYPPGPGGACPPSGCAPMLMPFCGPKSYTEPTSYLGYLYKKGGEGFNFRADAASLAGIQDLRHDYDLKGIWLEVMTPISFSNNSGIALGASHLFPLAAKSREAYISDVGAAVSREWNTDIQWWNVEMACTYKIGCTLTLISGFRWESFMTNFRDPSNSTLETGLPTDPADITFNGYIPFTGLELQTPLGCEGFVKAGAIGFPFLWSDYHYKETIGTAARLDSQGTGTSGYFLETWGEVGVKKCDISAGAFVRFSMLHAEDPTATMRALGTTAPATAVPFDFKYDQRNWIFGGRIGLSFMSPF